MLYTLAQQQYIYSGGAAGQRVADDCAGERAAALRDLRLGLVQALRRTQRVRPAREAARAATATPARGAARARVLSGAR